MTFERENQAASTHEEVAQQAEAAPGKRTRAQGAERLMRAPGRQTLVERSAGQASSDTLGEFHAPAMNDVVEAMGAVGRGERSGRLPGAGENPGMGATMWRVAESRAASLYRRAREQGGVDPHAPAVEAALHHLGSGQSLPAALRPRLDAAFGVSFERVRIHDDSVAAEACAAIHAHAFTVGEDIFFAPGAFDAQSPGGLQLLSHELAHVVQGMQGRTGGVASGERTVSAPGDALEQEADARAAAVAPKLATRATPQTAAAAAHDHAGHDRAATRGAAASPAPATQILRKDAQAPSAGAAPADTARQVAQVAADIVQNGLGRGIATAPKPYASPLQDLLAGVTGLDGSKKLTPDDRLKRIQSAKTGLHPVTAALAHGANQQWLDAQLTKPLASAVESIQVDRARQMVASTDPSDPKEQGAVMQESLGRLVPLVRSALGMIKRGKEHADELVNTAETISENEHVDAKLFKLEGLIQHLQILDGALALSDPKKWEEAHKANTMAAKCSSYTELISAGLNLMGGAVVVMYSYKAAWAKHLGDLAQCKAQSELAEVVGAKLEGTLSVIEIVKNVAVLCDDKSTSFQKADAAVGLTTAGINLGAQAIKWGVTKYGTQAAAETIGEAAGTAAFTITVPITIAWEEAKYFVQLYGDARVGLTGMWMNLALNAAHRDGVDLATHLRHLERAYTLSVAHPKDKAAYQRVAEEEQAQLGATLDDFIASCSPDHDFAGSAQYPGSYIILRELFAPVLRYRGAKSLDQLAEGSKLALEKIRWALEHRDVVTKDEAQQKHLTDAATDVAAEDKKRKEEGGKGGKGGKG